MSESNKFFAGFGKGEFFAEVVNPCNQRIDISDAKQIDYSTRVIFSERGLEFLKDDSRKVSSHSSVNP